MSGQYFVITSGEDGASVEQVSAAELKKRLDEGYWGHRRTFMDSIKESDPNYWRDGMVIIKGEIVVPQPVNVVKEYKI